MEGKYLKAQEHIEAHCLGNYTQSYLPMGELLLEMNNSGDISGYRRILDIENALSKLEYRQNGVKYIRETFISHPDKVLVMKAPAGLWHGG